MRFRESVRKSIAFSSLPEGEGELPAGPHAFTYRIPSRNVNDRDDNTAVTPGLPDEDGFLHGFVHFMRVPDEESKRGYVQRSLVLITHRPSLVGLFSAILAILGPLHFRYGGGAVIEAAARAIAGWSVNFNVMPCSVENIPYQSEWTYPGLILTMKRRWSSLFSDQSLPSIKDAGTSSIDEGAPLVSIFPS